ncbi:hypothetical protein [Methylobacterium sp.]|uniref:hypothetical protein n=1 Tax=Methylobacterium sp. TaxID=409 RepID=UPI00258B596A|nr:hypothetical protein [Methylobacterium sp.]
MKAIAAGGAMPLEIMLGAARTLWAKAHEGEIIDLDMVERAGSLAKDAAPYVHPRLASVAHTGPNNGPILTADLTKASNEQLDALEALLGPLAGAAGGDAEDDQRGEGAADG